MRLTKAAARALAEQLLEACATDDPEVVTGRPQGTYSETPLEQPAGFFLHPRGANLTIEIADMPAIQALLQQDRANPDPLSPQGDGRGFSR